jgi:hypothetical protein
VNAIRLITYQARLLAGHYWLLGELRAAALSWRSFTSVVAYGGLTGLRPSDQPKPKATSDREVSEIT